MCVCCVCVRVCVFECVGTRASVGGLCVCVCAVFALLSLHSKVCVCACLNVCMRERELSFEYICV